MKKQMFTVTLLCLIVALLCTSCSFGEPNSDQKIANARMDKVLNAIHNKDKEALKAMFSKKSIAQTENFDQSITDLFDYFQGDFVSYDDWAGPEGDETWEYGDKQKILYSSYDVKTSNKEYRFTIQDFTVDTADADNVGIHSLYIIKMEDDIDPQLGYRGDNKFTPGIHIGVKNTLPKEDDSISTVIVD